tara:strand:- start:61 stop:588 length:528 start_codon:yes stop_codon:yes gene_type:complete
MLDLRKLPGDLQVLVFRQMHRVCVDEMTVPELSIVRLVNVGMATTFYKRCIMLTMLGRYRPFAFRLQIPGTLSRYYDLHADYSNPCSLPKDCLDLNDCPFMNDTNAEFLRIKLACIFGVRPTHDREFMAAHRQEVCRKLRSQETKIFSIDRRKNVRQAHMDDNSDDFWPRKWVWI